MDFACELVKQTKRSLRVVAWMGGRGGLVRIIARTGIDASGGLTDEGLPLWGRCVGSILIGGAG